MFFFILNHQGPFPSCTSQSISPPLNALHYWACLWTCCVDSSDSNLVLLLRVLASKVHSCHIECVFFCGSSYCLFIYSIGTESASWSCGFNLQFFSWWEDVGSSSLAILPLGFNSGFISTSAGQWSTEVCSWGWPGGLGPAPVRTGCGSSTLPGPQEFWQHQACRGARARAAGDKVLLGSCLGSGSSGPLGIECGGGMVAWIMGNTQECQWLLSRRYGAITVFPSL